MDHPLQHADNDVAAPLLTRSSSGASSAHLLPVHVAASPFSGAATTQPSPFDAPRTITCDAETLSELCAPRVALLQLSPPPPHGAVPSNDQLASFVPADTTAALLTSLIVITTAAQSSVRRRSIMTMTALLAYNAGMILYLFPLCASVTAKPVNNAGDMADVAAIFALALAYAVYAVSMVSKLWRSRSQPYPLRMSMLPELEALVTRHAPVFHAAGLSMHLIVATETDHSWWTPPTDSRGNFPLTCKAQLTRRGRLYLFIGPLGACLNDPRVNARPQDLPREAVEAPFRQEAEMEEALGVFGVPTSTVLLPLRPYEEASPTSFAPSESNDHVRDAHWKPTRCGVNLAGRFGTARVRDTLAPLGVPLEDAVALGACLDAACDAGDVKVATTSHVYYWRGQWRAARMGLESYSFQHVDFGVWHTLAVLVGVAAGLAAMGCVIMGAAKVSAAGHLATGMFLLLTSPCSLVVVIFLYSALWEHPVWVRRTSNELALPVLRAALREYDARLAAVGLDAHIVAVANRRDCYATVRDAESPSLYLYLRGRGGGGGAGPGLHQAALGVQGVVAHTQALAAAPMGSGVVF